MPSAEAAVIELPSGKRRVLIERSTFARFVPPGWLVFVRGGAVFAVRLDLRSLRVEGTPVAVREPISVGGSAGTASFDVTRDGTLVYVSGPRIPETNDRPSFSSTAPAGRPPCLSLRPSYDDPAFSPDGRRIVLQKCVGMSCKLHVFDRERGVLSPLATEPGRFFSPVWSPDGREVAFSHLMSEDPRAAAAGGRRQRDDPAAPDERRERGVPERHFAGRSVPPLHRLVRHRPRRDAAEGDGRPLDRSARRVEPRAPVVRESRARVLGRDLARRPVGRLRLRRDGPKRGLRPLLSRRPVRS